MYQGIKSYVKYKECQSDLFPCLTGVRQGENVSSFLFSVFLNDLEDYFKTLDGVPLEKLTERFIINCIYFLNYLSYYMLMTLF